MQAFALAIGVCDMTMVERYVAGALLIGAFFILALMVSFTFWPFICVYYM